MIKKICLYCKKEFEVENWRKETAKYCSRECSNKSKEKTILIKCKYCGEEFKPKKKQTKYCTHKCATNDQKLKLKKCLNCGLEFKPYKSFLKFCSVKCSGEYHSKEKNGMYKGKIEFTCKQCGKKYFNYPSRKNRSKFCCEKCRIKWLKLNLRGENSHLWKGGTLDWRGENWKSQRGKALKRDNYKCQHCGSVLDLVVHHIKNFRLFGKDYITANKLKNLITLCRSCHVKLHHRENKQ